MGSKPSRKAKGDQSADQKIDPSPSPSPSPAAVNSAAEAAPSSAPSSTPPSSLPPQSSSSISSSPAVSREVSLAREGSQREGGRDLFEEKEEELPEWKEEEEEVPGFSEDFITQAILDTDAVVVTGANGFFGRCMLYKLLIQTKDAIIYAFIRGDAKAKLQEMFNEDHGLAHLKHLQSRVRPVSWDLQKEGFGIPQATIDEILPKVSWVIHTAAVWLDKDIERINLEASINLRKIFWRCGFVFMSNVYVNRFLAEDKSEELKLTFKEEFYYYPHLQPEVTKESFIYPYLYTKARAEYELARLNEQKGCGPLVVIRLTGTTFSFRYPYPGWGKSTHGLQNLIYLIGIGLLRLWRTTPKGTMTTGIVPVDAACNVTYQLMLDVSSGTAKPTLSSEEGSPVYLAHADTSSCNPLDARVIVERAVTYFKENPLLLRKLEPAVQFVTTEAAFKLRESLLKYRDKIISETQISFINALVKNHWGPIGSKDLIFKARYKHLLSEWEWDDDYFVPWFKGLGRVMTIKEYARIQKANARKRKEREAREAREAAAGGAVGVSQ